MRRRNLLRLLGMIGGLILLGVVWGMTMGFDPDFCEKKCPICTRARKGSGFAKSLQNIEMTVTFGGCPWGRARQKKYGVKPNEPLPNPKPV